MMSKLKEITTTATFRQSTLVSTATVINGFLGLLFYVITPRFLGPSLFGIFSISVAVGTAVSDISDFGVNTGIVKFVGKYSKNPTIANRYLKISLKIKVIVSLIVFVSGFLISDFMATIVFGKPELANYLRLAFLGVSFTLFYGFITSALQAYQKFFAWSLVQIGTNLLRLLLIFLLVALGILSLTNSLFVYILMPLIGFFVGLFFLKQRFWNANGESGVVKELFNFNKWIAAFIFISAISSRLDTFISARFLNTFDLGLYAVAVQLTQVVPQIAGALSIVIAPKMASMTNIGSLVVYFKKVQLMVFGLAGLGLVLIPIGIALLPVFYGQSYQGSTPVFVVLFIAMLVFLISVPIHNVIIYYFSYPKFFWWLSLGHLAIISFFGLNLIPKYGLMGASLSVLVGSTFNFIIPSVWLINRIYRSGVN